MEVKKNATNTEHSPLKVTNVAMTQNDVTEQRQQNAY